jgi:hypothetical protein
MQRVAYLHDTKLVGNRRKLRCESVVSDLEYADDVVLVADSWDDLRAMLVFMDACCRDMGLSISSSQSYPLIPVSGLSPSHFLVVIV